MRSLQDVYFSNKPIISVRNIENDYYHNHMSYRKRLTKVKKNGQLSHSFTRKQSASFLPPITNKNKTKDTSFNTEPANLVFNSQTGQEPQLQKKQLSTINDEQPASELHDNTEDAKHTSLNIDTQNINGQDKNEKNGINTQNNYALPGDNDQNIKEQNTKTEPNNGKNGISEPNKEPEIKDEQLNAKNNDIIDEDKQSSSGAKNEERSRN